MQGGRPYPNLITVQINEFTSVLGVVRIRSPSGFGPVTDALAWTVVVVFLCLDAGRAARLTALRSWVSVEDCPVPVILCWSGS